MLLQDLDVIWLIFDLAFQRLLILMILEKQYQHKITLLNRLYYSIYSAYFSFKIEHLNIVLHPLTHQIHHISQPNLFNMGIRWPSLLTIKSHEYKVYNKYEGIWLFPVVFLKNVKYALIFILTNTSMYIYVWYHRIYAEIRFHVSLQKS